MKTRPYNFGAGPSMLPEAILLQAQKELLDWQGLGVSVMEIGHRTLLFQTLLETLEYRFRELLKIPQEYQVLFLSGAARTQFAMIPMNLLSTKEKAGYLVTGIWSKLAFQEAQKIKKAYCIANTEGTDFTSLPEEQNWYLEKDTTYIYYTPNETVNGVQFHQTPTNKNIPLIADMTSCLLTEPIDISKFGLIFAGAQKNISIAGLTVIIIHQDLLKTIDVAIPTMLDYKIHAQHKSSYATPPTFNCYMALKMLDWVQLQGGVETLYKINCQKATLLYQYIDSSEFYNCAVAKNARSIVNVCFNLKNKTLEAVFLKGAEQRGLLALQGHRTVAGLRASLYNSMPLSGVEALISYMMDFARAQQ